MNNEIDRTTPEINEEPVSVAAQEFRRLDVAFWPIMLGALSVQLASVIYFLLRNGDVNEFTPFFDVIVLGALFFTIALATPLAYAIAMWAAWRSRTATHVASPTVLGLMVGMLFPIGAVLVTYMMVEYANTSGFYPALMTFITATIAVSFASAELLAMSCARTDRSKSGHVERSGKRARRRSVKEWFQRHFAFSFGGLMACLTFVAVSLGLLLQTESSMAVLWVGLLPLIGNGTMFFLARKQRYLMFGSVLVCIAIPWFTFIVFVVTAVLDFGASQS